MVTVWGVVVMAMWYVMVMFGVMVMVMFGIMVMFGVVVRYECMVNLMRNFIGVDRLLL
jgi:hypothetical protein